ncbi:MAG: choice-of-anchor tandem repeat NxxGxxAF-containing protein [Planctomycetota bacterium]
MSALPSPRVLLSASITLFGGQVCAQSFVFTTVARDGEALPGLAAGNIAEVVLLQGLDPAGGLGVVVQESGPGITGDNDTGYWSTDGVSPFSPVLREGDPAPGFGPGVVVARLRDGQPRENGRWAIRGTIEGPGITPLLNDAVIWVDSGSGLVPVVQSGTGPPPGFPAGATYTTLALRDFNSAGYLVFESPVFISPTNRRDGLFAVAPDGSVRLVAQESAELPGLPGSRVQNPSVFERSVDASGNVLFGGTLIFPPSPQGPSSRRVVALSRPDGTTELVAQTDTQAVDYPTGFAFDFFGQRIVSDDQKILFTAAVVDDQGVPVGEGIYMVTPASGPRRVVATGEPAPGFPAGSVLESLRAVTVNNSGDVTFAGQASIVPGVTFGSDTGIWSKSGEQVPLQPIELLVREGDPAPGAPAGATFADLVSGAVRTADGTAVFQASLRGADSGTDDGIWVWRPDGVIAIVTREGNPLNIVFNGQSEQRTVTGVGFDSRSSATDDGRIGLSVRFDGGGSAVIVAAPGPECPADINGDGDATPADFNAWLAAFNSQAPGCDQNGDGLCDPSDFNAWVVNFNVGCD